MANFPLWLKRGDGRWRLPRPKLYTVYFALAAFDLLTVCGGLYLSHRIMAIYEQSVAVNQEWAGRLTGFSKLSALASEANAPGNDVFDSHDVARERARRDAALAAFNAHLSGLRLELPAAGHKELSGALDRIDHAMIHMATEAELIFKFFETGQSEAAGSRMATMDRKYAYLTKAVNAAGGIIQAIQADNFKAQLAHARGLRQYEYLIGALILLMVGCVSLYGHKIGRVMRKAEEERERLVAALAERERLATSRLNDAIESLAEGFAFYDADDRLIMCNHRYLEMFGGDDQTQHPTPGMSFAEVTKAELRRGAYRGLAGGESAWFMERLRHHRDADGDIRVEIDNNRWVRLYDRRTSEGGVVVMSFDVTQRVEDERKLEHLAQHDALTGLPNRAAFFDFLEQGLAEAKTGFACKGVAVHYVDLDHFKRINDSLGHDAGDHVLREVARRLKQVSGAAHPCRLGGDEFAVVQSVTGDGREVSELAGCLLTALREPIAWEGHLLVVHASIGLAQSAGESIDPLSLVKQADLALYAAKDGGRNGFRQFDQSLDQRHARRLAVEAAILKACEHNGFELHYQPILALTAAKLTGFEALIRLPQADGATIAPLEFIPIAEDLGKIEEIGAWCLLEACRTAASWQNDLTVAVNISTLQFQSGRLVEFVKAALDASRLPPHRLELEITETLLLEDSPSVQEQLQGLKRLGIKISLDDFGTGYSALNYLWRFPLDKIKIDRSFINALDQGDSAKGVLSAIVELGHRLHVPIVAEGVENEQQRRFLSELGCELAQGYLFGRPVAGVDLPAVILRNFTRSLKPWSGDGKTAEANGTMTGTDG